MSIGDNVRKVSAVMGIMRALNGKKTTIATIVSIVSLAWSMFLPGTAPTEGQIMDAFTQGQQIVDTAREDVLPPLVTLVAQTVGLAGMILAFFFGLHSQAKIARLLRVVGQLAGRFIDLDDLDDPVLVEKLKGENLPLPSAGSSPIRATVVQTGQSSSPPITATVVPKPAESDKA